MISPEKMHSKHTKLSKPLYGEYHRNEWAILGTPCSEIRTLASHIVKGLGNKWQLAYLDADHKEEENKNAEANSLLKHGARLELTDKISFFRSDAATAPNPFQWRSTLNELDAVLVNGNHFTAARQVVVIDSRKDLTKKEEKLTDVVLVLLAGDEAEVPELVKRKIKQDTPVYPISDTDQIVAWFEKQLQLCIAPVSGLVLAGGKGSRMQADKGLIFYHDLPQREYLYKMISDMGLPAYLSLRTDQAAAVAEDMAVVPDTFSDLGPYGAILSAFRSDPNSAWLSVACDLPLLKEEHLRQLILRRNPSKMATAYYNPTTNFPEPLITLWEPKAYPVLLQFLAQGYSCPRKALINSEVEIIAAGDPAFMMNANTPEERNKANILLAGSK